MYRVRVHAPGPKSDPPRRPWHFWAVAAAVFALYVGGSRDYLLILAQDTTYIEAQFGPGGLAYFRDYPLGLRIVWTTNIVAGLVAPVLLVAGDARAVHVAITAAAAQLVLLPLTFALRDRWAALGAATSWFDIGVGVVTALFAGYCWAMARRGHIGSALSRRHVR